MLSTSIWTRKDLLNIQHPTRNIQHPISLTMGSTFRGSILDILCWILDIQNSKSLRVPMEVDDIRLKDTL